MFTLLSTIQLKIIVTSGHFFTWFILCDANFVRFKYAYYVSI